MEELNMNVVVAEEIEEVDENVELDDEMEMDYEMEDSNLGNLIKVGLGVGLLAGGAFAFRKKIAAKIEQAEVARLEKKGYLIHKPLVEVTAEEETEGEPEAVEAEEVKTEKPKKKGKKN